MRCQRVLWSLSWRHSQRCGASRPFSSQPLRWSSSRAPEDSFKQFYWDEENVLYLYAIQRVQLAPNVQEDVKLRDGKQHVDITWQLGEHGERLAGSGRARSKKQARREAAKKLLKLLPVGKEAEIQMRKQMLQGLRYKLSAEVVEDGVAGAVNNDRGLQQIYRVLWKVPRPQGRAPAEVSAEGRGGTVAEAQADAWENLYIQARRKNLHAAASQAVYEEREERKRQQLEDAAEQRQQQVNEGMSILTSEAASELAVRHNTVVQRLRIQAKDEMAAHEAGYHCVLHWSWEDPSGESRSARSSGLGSSKRQARGEAMQKMLAEQGFGSFEATALNDAARVRGLAKAGDPQSTPLACSFMLNWPTSHWGLVLIEVWQSALARQDLAAVQELGAAVQSVSDGLGPQLWESLLDAPAHVACGKTAMEALKALQGVSLIASGFPSYAHRDYFQHFRLLTAMERIGANQAMVEELRSQSDVMSLRMRQQNCVLPYLTLAPASSGNAHWSPSIFTELRQGDVVYLKSGRDHLAVITSIVKDGKQKLTLRCHTLSLDDVDEEWFDVYGLESEVTTLRCISALWSASQPHASLEERPATQLMLNREMTKILVESFLPEGLTKAREVARSLPPGCDPGSMDQRLQMLQKSIPSHVNLSESQMRSVQSALQQRLTLIHGPPGTGKTTAAVSVLSAWRSLGDRILCAADSNVAADNLHQNLQKWGVKSYRFSPTEMHQTGERATAYQRMLAIQDAIGSFQIVVTTCASAGHELLRGYNFPRVLIDESTQSIEPSTLLPIINGCSHLVLIGDHRQLPPTVISDDARRLGLDRSLFARLAEPKANAVVEPLLLNEQRRMHPSIAEFPNRHFYNGLVQDQVSSRPPIPGVQFPQQDATRVLLVDCAAETAETAEEQYGTSWRNVAEVQAVRDFVAHVLSPSRHGPKPLEPEQIVVLTPYLQKELLQSALEKAKLQVRVSTVDGFQGAEADLVLFSAVRANLSGRLGFLQDTRRANVALTRARRGLVVFADATTLRESKGSVWATWLEWLEARDGIRELDELYQDVLI